LKFEVAAIEGWTIGVLDSSSRDATATGPEGRQLAQLWVKRKSASEHKQFGLHERLDHMHDTPTEQVRSTHDNKNGQAASHDFAPRFGAFTR
jgi:hypothetical protein